MQGPVIVISKPDSFCRSGWLGGILPVKALEDNLCALSLAGGAELGEEVEEEEQEPDYSNIPLAFNQPRHLQVPVHSCHLSVLLHTHTHTSHTKRVDFDFISDKNT